MAAAEVQIVSQSNLQKIESFFSDSAYREAIENSANFNTRLCVERRLRMPFLDPQTGVAQTHCNLFMHRRQRMPGFREGQLYTYPAARWRKAKRQYLSLHRGGWGELGCGVGGGIGGDDDGLGIGSGIGLGRDGEGGMESHDTDSKDSHHKDDGSKDWFYDDMTMEEMDAFEEPEPDSDEDYCDESYSARKRRAEKEKGLDKADKSTPGVGRGGRKGRGAGIVDPDGVTTTPKGRGRGGGRGRKKAVQQVLPYEVPGDADKPYGCERMIPRNTLPVCGARYKTRPGLTYHYTHSHKEGGGGSDGDSRDSPARGPTPSTPSTLPPIVVPPDQPSTEYQDSYVTFITGNRRSMVGSTATTTGSTATTSTSSTNNTVTPSPTPASSATSAPAVTATSSSPARTASPSSPKTGPGEAGKASPYCDFCLGDQNCNKKTGVPEELVSCSDCGRSGHPTCLQFTDNMIVSVRKYRWQCIECKCCSVCGTSDNDDQLLFCDDCDRGYHMYCLTPPLAAPPEGSWSCALCIQEFHTAK